MKQRSICDFRQCSNPVEDERNIMIGRMNPWDRYAKFQTCDNCMMEFMKYINLKLKKEPNEK
jgi:hypothetical protein